MDEERLPISRQAVLHKPEALLDANPRGQVPTLVAGDLVLYDSTVILEWLEERHPELPLLPRGVRPRPMPSARATLLAAFGRPNRGNRLRALAAYFPTLRRQTANLPRAARPNHLRRSLLAAENAAGMQSNG